jgi:hypothetical protein
MTHRTAKQRAWINIAATILILGLAIGLSWYGIRHPDTSLFALWVPVTVTLALFAVKLAWPRIPGYQVALLAVIALATHYALEHLGPPAMLVSELAMQVVCAAIFGSYWVRKGYISREANRW